MAAPPSRKQLILYRHVSWGSAGWVSVPLLRVKHAITTVVTSTHTQMFCLLSQKKQQQRSLPARKVKAKFFWGGTMWGFGFLVTWESKSFLEKKTAVKLKTRLFPPHPSTYRGHKGAPLMTSKRNLECRAARGLRYSAYSGHTHVLPMGQWPGGHREWQRILGSGGSVIGGDYSRSFDR